MKRVYKITIPESRLDSALYLKDRIRKFQSRVALRKRLLEVAEVNIEEPSPPLPKYEPVKRERLKLRNIIYSILI